MQLKPELLTPYQQASEHTGKTVFMLCRQDWLKAPEVTDLRQGAYTVSPATTAVPVGKPVIVEVYVHDHPGNKAFTSGEQKIK